MRGYILLRFPGWFILTMFAAPAACFAQETMTLSGALAHVWSTSPVIASAQHGVSAVEELEVQAKSGWHPKLAADANITSTRIDSGNFTQGDGATTKGAAVNLEQPLFRGFRTVAETAAAQERIAAERQRLDDIAQSVFLETAEAYMNVIRDRMILDLERQNKFLLAKEQESVTARFQAGDITQTDVKQTEARYANAVADSAIAESRLNESEALFERTVGLMPPPSMVMPEPDFSFPVDIRELIELAALQNPALARARYDHEAAEEDIRIVKSDYFPQVSAFASHLKEYDPQPGIVAESETSSIGVRARISLYEGGNTLSRVREAKSRASQRFADTVAIGRSVRSDIVADWKRLAALGTEIEARELEVAAARYSSEGVKEEARLGERTVLDTLDAEQDVLIAGRALVEARRDRIVTAYRLAASLGLLTPGRLGFKPLLTVATAD